MVSDKAMLIVKDAVFSKAMGTTVRVFSSVFFAFFSSFFFSASLVAVSLFSTFFSHELAFILFGGQLGHKLLHPLLVRGKQSNELLFRLMAQEGSESFHAEIVL